MNLDIDKIVLKEFNLERALAGDPVVTRGGKKVIEIVMLKSEVIFPIICSIEGRDQSISARINGKFHYNLNDESEFDLFMAPKEKIKAFISVCSESTSNDGKTFNATSCAYRSKEDIPEVYKKNQIIEIEIEE